MIFFSSVQFMICIAFNLHLILYPDTDTTLTYDIKVKFIGFLTWPRFPATAFCPLTLSYHIWHMYVSPFMTSVWPWALASISKLYFHYEFVWPKSSLLCEIGIPNLAHNFCQHTNMWMGDGVSLVSCTHSFYLAVLCPGALKINALNYQIRHSLELLEIQWFV